MSLGSLSVSYWDRPTKGLAACRQIIDDLGAVNKWLDHAIKLISFTWSPEILKIYVHHTEFLLPFLTCPFITSKHREVWFSYTLEQSYTCRCKIIPRMCTGNTTFGECSRKIHEISWITTCWQLPRQGFWKWGDNTTR